MMGIPHSLCIFGDYEIEVLARIKQDDNKAKFVIVENSREGAKPVFPYESAVQVNYLFIKAGRLSLDEQIDEFKKSIGERISLFFVCAYGSSQIHLHWFKLPETIPEHPYDKLMAELETQLEPGSPLFKYNPRTTEKMMRAVKRGRTLEEAARQCGFKMKKSKLEEAILELDEPAVTVE
jgi:hypothetical protein